ncbi:hypothetical protein RDV89_02915 [Nocardioides zeae]|uniref:ARB-07466-like C-terminal domain-containing protein n=1 Tax=Nocardioides imazamoxiresistens TaxID=3231893 RepID=A0ABU3PS26_9ACTN|nr:hypothetical protein [Nocardioides zeae]MDT9592001.1 hypothetical protein [Nocardioides zeae]
MSHVRRGPQLLVLLAALLAGLATLAAPTSAGAAPGLAAYRSPVDPYPRYEPQKHCISEVRAGTRAYANMLTSRYGGRIIGITRACNVGGQSEHKESRAIDWNLDARTASGRDTFGRYLREMRAFEGNQYAALARRYGVAYIIFNDKIWSAWNGYQERPYRHASCKDLWDIRNCPATLRHLDHVHVTLSWTGANGHTTAYRR